MFDFEAEAAKLPPETKDKPPSMPIDIALMQGERVFSFANPERDELLKVQGFEIRYLDDMPSIHEVLRAMQHAMDTASDEKLKTSSKPVREESDALIGKVMTGARYIYRRDPDAMRQLDRIGQTGAAHDRYGDLLRVATFVEAHPDLITADPRIPADAATRARELASMVAAQESFTGAKDAVARRNLAFWMLNEAVSEVRAAVRFRFSGEKGKENVIQTVCERYEMPKKKGKGERAATTTPAEPASE